jgi:hypothetical protein
MLPVKRNGNDVYIVTAKMVTPGKRTNRVQFRGKLYFWPRIHAEEAPEYGWDRWAIRSSFYNIMFDQDKTKRIIKSKLALQRNPIRRISKN